MARALLLAFGLVAAALLAPTAAAEGTPWLFLCTEEFPAPTVVTDKVVLGCDTDSHGCEGLTVIVGAEDACRSDHDAGCDGLTILVSADNSCRGGPGDPGCRGNTLLDPTTDGACRGGDGERLLALLRAL